MADDRVVNEIVTKFFLDTCQLRQQLNTDSLHGFSTCFGTSFLLSPDSIPLTTGSVAELYIRPMLTCVGDVDVMLHRYNELAIPVGTAPPTQLPAEFNNHVTVCEIIDSEFPGYVYLVRSYLLTECIEDGRYSAVRCPRVYTPLLRVTDIGDGTHGPATVKQSTLLRPQFLARLTESMHSTDYVYCMRCLSWPSQAADWPLRHREHGWPDSATVDCVISNGCDVVNVAHHRCREDKWMGKHQMRLSFSRAEIVLLNSWMPVQQIVYHMLRVFMKTERLTDSVNNTGVKVFTNYHIKTLMLWACEMKPRSWWTDDLDLLRICVELLHILAVWLNDGRCANYFIICNLFDYDNNSHCGPTHCIARQLLAVTEPWLAAWYINNYVRKCAQSCKEHVLRLFDDVSSMAKLHDAVSAVAAWRIRLSHMFHYVAFQAALYVITHYVSSFTSITVQSRLCCMRVSAQLNQRLCVHFIATKLLHVAHKTTRNSLTDELLDVLATTCLQSNDARRWLNARHSSVLSLSQAAMLMKVVANNSRNTVQLIEIELSKAYLYRAMRCKDSDSDSIYCLANVYLAVLYYVTGHYQTAIDHCKLVTRSQDHSQCSSHVVQGELLPKIDDDIDNVLGLSVFYQYVRTAALNQQVGLTKVTIYNSVFTTELFAHYLLLRCRSAETCQMLNLRYMPSPARDMFITDVLAFCLVSRTQYTAYDRARHSTRDDTKPVMSCQLDTSELVELLEQSAVERLTKFRQVEADEFGSVPVGSEWSFGMVTTDFEALYAYKCGEYQRCLQLSTHNVHTLLVPDTTPCILSHPEFLQLMDNNISSLVGLTLIVNTSSREVLKHVEISQLPLSLYLMSQCQMKLHHSVTSLVQTLLHVAVARTKRLLSLWTLDQLLLKLTERKTLRYLVNPRQSLAISF